MAVVGFLYKRLLPNYKLHNKPVLRREFQLFHVSKEGVLSGLDDGVFFKMWDDETRGLHLSRRDTSRMGQLNRAGCKSEEGTCTEGPERRVQNANLPHHIRLLPDPESSPTDASGWGLYQGVAGNA